MGKILDKIDKPQDLKLIRRELMPELLEEIRNEIIETVSRNGGHIASSLGCVELITALHYVYNTPEDKIIFDVGHQAYAHKLLTGRRDKFKTLRQYEGISGFPVREESEYDAFGVGHSSTSISAALGFAVARDLKGEKNKVIAVIGDGSMTGGMAFEGLNNAGHINTDMLVILNDNEMFISRRVGAIVGYFAKLLTLGSVKRIEKRIETFLMRIRNFGSYFIRIARRFKFLFIPSLLFEEMGFTYIGPVDGNNFNALVEILSNIKKNHGPTVLHIVTKKGKGYHPAEKNPIKFHGAAKFEIETGEAQKFAGTDNKPTYTEIFGQTLVDLAKSDDKIVAITAAMSEGTGLKPFANEFPKRFFDVGIAEQHALTFAAGLAVSGLKPVVALYSTFLQRGFDQLIHDVALQNLPVIIAIDRAGIVGDDGKTHQGIFDISFMRLIPNFVIMSPKDEQELKDMLYTATQLNKPVAIRYPRGKSIGVKLNALYTNIPLGKAEELISGKDMYILAAGNMVYPALETQKMLKKENIDAGVINMRYIKPLDEKLIGNISKKAKKIVTLEEGVLTGGLGSAIKEIVSGPDVKILNIALPDKFIEHGSQDILRNKYGLSSDKMFETIKKWYAN
ncbi:MAG: 1-deoxy-D-xylulose-5-phosphate synthase [Elusimicrobia bacterium]|nr:1-deoxy-D-xylulose-5-phosphate synthase [Elusimicrobiota bacterium]MBU2614512.1 1-deoxy-D-xylulose-5-phosphate synthase [Elusimicrobiota bacterium]